MRLWLCLITVCVLHEIILNLLKEFEFTTKLLKNLIRHHRGKIFLKYTKLYNKAFLNCKCKGKYQCQDILDNLFYTIYSAIKILYYYFNVFFSFQFKIIYFIQS